MRGNNSLSYYSQGKKENNRPKENKGKGKWLILVSFVG